MDRQVFIDILRAQPPWRTPLWSFVRAPLYLASLPYAALMRLRRWAYRKGILPSRAVARPVISVGNITAGGTGKTPMVAWIARELRTAGRCIDVLVDTQTGAIGDTAEGGCATRVTAGRRVGIVLRGYKSHQGKSDEAELLKQLTGAIVVTNANRVAGACDAGAAGAEVIVLDDGFQHRRLRRNLDVVLIDASDPFGIGYCLPRGLLREPPSALRDAGAIVITRGDAAAPDELDHLRKRLSLLSPKAILCRAVHRPSALIDEAGNRAPPTTIAGRKVFAFCGIGNPRSFFQTLTGLGAKVVGQCALEDHCQYTDPLLEELCEDADESGAEIMVTTQKDYVKIAPRKLPLPLYQLEIEMDVVEGREELVRRLMKIL